MPHPPLLVPELVGAAAAEVDPLRTACVRAARGLGTGRWYAIGVDPSGPAIVGPQARGTFAGYGVDVPVSLADATAATDATTAAAEATDAAVTDAAGTPTRLALPLLVAGWLRGQAGARSVTGELVHPSADPAACVARGKELAAELDGTGGPGSDWGVLVLADGAATHDVPGAGRVDARAPAFDEAVAAALEATDAEALAALDAGLAATLGTGGRAAWQVLAGLVLGSAATWRGELLYHAAPYGVGYHVACWERR